MGGLVRQIPHPRTYAFGNSLVSNETRLLARLDRIYYARSIDRKLNRVLDPCDWLPNETRRYCWDESLDLESRAQKLLQYDFNGAALSRTERLCGAADLVAWSPFQSPAVLSVAQTLPSDFRMRGDVAKPLLRALCDRYLPAEISRWSKMGFETPRDDWFAGPLAPAIANARRDPFVQKVFDLVGLSIEDVSLCPELTWTCLALSECRLALDLQWRPHGP